MRGAYVLIIKIETPTEVHIESLGQLTFQPGKWVYVGSAMGNGSTSLENRLLRHFRDEKTIYWHIDYLLATDAELVYAIWAESPNLIECELAQKISSSTDFDPGPQRFGSSDCKKKCSSHIFKCHNDNPLDETLCQIFHNLKLKPHLTKTGLL